jgi:DNA-directed RNA polymerase subunit RPC12/RpoP/predicted RNA-binding Zn-ribbon protein involved in translation (DUF1610 family)
VTPAWALLALAAPPAAAILAAALLAPRRLPPAVPILTNAVFPGAGLAAARRPLLEVAAGVLLAQVALVIVGRLADLWMYLPIMVIGGLWAAWHSSWNPIEKLAQLVPDNPPAAPASEPAAPSVAPVSSPSAPLDDDASGYAVALHCTECGAEVVLPVLHRMAHCDYCGSYHLVVGHEDLLQVTLPERAGDLNTLREAILDHHRRLHYLKLYHATVAPLARAGTRVAADGTPLDSPEADLAAAAAEAAVNRAADGFRAKLATTLHIGSADRFLTPYYHGMGVLYEAVFGREPVTEDKVLRFTVGAVEAATEATSLLDLPPMGKLSWLRALLPVAALPEDARCLPADRAPAQLDAAYGDLDRKRLVRDLRSLRVGNRLHEDVRAVVWRPWWVCSVEGPHVAGRILVDAASGTVVGDAPDLDPQALEPLPAAARNPATGLRFIPMECPTCGWEYPFSPQAVLHFCANCHRVFRVQGQHKLEVPYGHDPRTPEVVSDLVPFWSFRLELRTGDGEVVTDLRLLKDGVDGTLDQLGEGYHPVRHAIAVPAVRCVVAKLTSGALRELFAHALRHPPAPTWERFPLEVKPEPWPVTVDEAEARRLAPLLLATVFTRRDLARADVHQVATRLLTAKLEGAARLVFLYMPKALTGPFRRYVGRMPDTAVSRAEGTASSPSGGG